MVEVVQAVWSPASGDVEEVSGRVGGDVGVGTAGDELLHLVGYGHTVEWFSFQDSAYLMI